MAIIGKVAVKVIPDTKQFRKELKAQLEAIEKKLEPIKVKVALDGDKIKADAKKIEEEAKKALKSITIRVNIKDQDNLRANIARIEAELKKLDEKSIKVKLNRKDLNARLDKLKADLDKVAHINLRVDKKNLDSVTRAIEQIDAELAKLAEQEIKVKLDEKSLNEQRAKYQKILDAEAKRVQADADRRLQESIQRSQLLIDRVNSALNDIKWAPDVDKAKLAATKREIETVLYKIEDLNAKIKVEMDPLAKRKLELELEALQARIHDLKASVKPEVDNSAKLNVQLALAALARTRDVVFKPVMNNRALRGVAAALDRLSGFRDGRETMDNLRDILFNLDLMLPKIASVATGIGGIGAGLASLSAQLFALSSALAQIAAGLALALPGALVSLGVAFWVAQVALDDFKNRLPDVVREYGTLKQAIKDNFWAKALDPLRTMAHELFPEIKSGLEAVSTSMGGFFGNFADSIRKILGGELAGMFENVAGGVDKLSEHTDAFAQILGVLGRVGSQFFEDMMGELGKAADGWAEWLTEAEKTGKLKKMIDDAVRGLKNLWRAGKNLLGIFDGIADAAERALGADVLTTLADRLEHIQKIVHSPQFQKELTEVFVAARKAMDEISNRAGPALERAFKNLGDLVEDVFPKIGSTIGELFGGIADAFNDPTFLSGARGFFESLQGFAEDLRPAWDNVGAAIGSVLDLISTFIDTASPGVATAIENVAGWVDILAQGLKPLAEGLGQALSATLDAVAPGITAIVTAIKDFAEGDGGAAIIGFFMDLAPLIGDIADWLGRAATELAKWGNENLPKIREDLQPIIDDFRAFLDEHGDEMIRIITGIGDALVFLIDQLSGLSPVVADLVVAGSLLLLAKRIRGLGSAIDFAIKKVPKGGLAAALGLTALLVFINADADGDGILGWLGKLRETLKDIGGFLSPNFGGDLGGSAFGWLQDLADGIGRGVQAVLDVVGAARGPLGFLWDLIFDHGGEGTPDYSGGGAAGGAPGTPPKSNWGPDGPPWKGEIENNLNQIPPMFDNTFGEVQTASYNWNTDMNATFATGMGQLQTTTRENVTPLPGIFSGGLGGMLDTFLGWLPGFNQNWGGFWTGLGTSGSGIWGWIEGLFGTHQENMKSKAQTGMGDVQATTDGGWLSILGSTGGWLGELLEKVTGGFNELEPGARPGTNSLVELVTALPGRIIQGLGDLKSLLVESGKDVIRGFMDGIGSMAQSVIDKVKSVIGLAPSTANKELDVRSPSRVFAEIGRHTIDGFIVGMESRYDAVKSSLRGLAGDVAGMDMGTLASPGVGGMSGRINGAANGAYAHANGTTNKVLNYYAAPNSSISSEEDLFRAGNRARMGW